MYTIARMLRNFDKKKNNKNVWGGKNKDKCNGESLKKIINFAGQSIYMQKGAPTIRSSQTFSFPTPK